MSESLRDVRLLVCIAFHYVESRLCYLRAVLSQHPALAGEIDVRIFTNTNGQNEIGKIEACFPSDATNTTCGIVSASDLPHPYFLPWVHKQVLANDFLGQLRYTHFLYAEDDLLVRPENIAYWLSAREVLRNYGLIPSFFRVEKRLSDNVWRSTDLTKKINLYGTPKVRVTGNRWYINLKNPYQAMYLFDQELAREHLAGPARNPDFKPWGIREQAAQGQTFVAVPKGFTARNVVPLDTAGLTIDSCCRVHHLPNNYANDSSSSFGQIAVDDLVAHPWLSKLLIALT